jgi:cell division ATPase FtsA
MSKGHIVAGLDIGTSATKVLVASRKPGEEDLSILSLIQEPSLGVRKGVVFNAENVKEISQIALRRPRKNQVRK